MNTSSGAMARIEDATDVDVVGSIVEQSMYRRFSIEDDGAGSLLDRMTSNTDLT